MTEEKEKKKLKSVIGFLSANKINMYNRVGEGEKSKRNPKQSTEQVKKISIINVFLEKKKTC